MGRNKKLYLQYSTRVKCTFTISLCGDISIARILLTIGNKSELLALVVASWGLEMLALGGVTGVCRFVGGGGGGGGGGRSLARERGVSSGRGRVEKPR